MLKKKKKTDGLLVLRDEERETESLAAETERTQAVPQLKRHPCLTLSQISCGG